MKNKNTQSGFTLPELLITMVMTSLLVGLIMFFTFNYWTYSYIAQADQETLTERLNANDFIRDYIGSSSGLITQNSIVDTHAGLADTTGAGANYWAPVHAVPGNIAAGSMGAISPILYFKRYSLNTSNQIIYNGTNPYEDEYVLYLDTTKNAIRLRTLANPNAANNRAVTSCPASAASASCPADRTLITNIASVDKRFFSRSGNLIDWTSIYDNLISQYVGPDNAAVEVIELKLNLSAKARFQKTNSTTSTTVIRVALRNV